jgi:hypothetical protein
MSMARSVVSVVSVVCMAVVRGSTVEAQTADAIGIRAQGMAGAFTAVADDATASWWNPAGLATGAYFNGVLEGGDDHHRGLAVAFPALGLSYYRHRINQIQPVDSTATPSADRQDPGTGDVRLRSFDVSQFGATVGQSIGGHLVVASTLKLMNGADTTHGDLDVGAMATFGVARIGVVVRNVTRPTFGEGVGAYEFERTVRAGAAVTTARRGAVSATLALDADLRTLEGPTGPERRIAAGAEVWSRTRTFGGRVGISGSTVGSAPRKTSVGASVAVRSRTYLEAQYTNLNEGDPSKSVGLAVRVTF